MQVDSKSWLARLVRVAGVAERAGERLAPNRYALEVDAQLQVARERTGLSDFGHPMFIDGMEAWFDALNRSPDVTGLGHLLHRVRTQMCLTNRLWLQRDFARHAEAMRQPVLPPLFIIGPTRTGTTLLQNLLTADPDVRTLLSYETFRPTTDQGPLPSGPDRRLRMHQGRWWFVKTAVPDFPRIHWVEAHEPDECGILLANTFCTAILDATVPTPGYMRWFLQQDLTPAYQHYRDTLKILQLQRTTARRWVLKCPYHLWGLKAMLEVFPDAVFVQMHRRMDQVIPSTCSMFATLRKIDSDVVDREAIGQEVPARWAQALELGMEARKHADPARFMDIRYEDLVADPLSTVQSIYERFGLPWREELRAPMQQWLRDNPQNKRGAHAYSMDEFGLSTEQLDELFGPYEQQFGVAADQTEEPTLAAGY